MTIDMVRDLGADNTGVDYIDHPVNRVDQALCQIEANGGRGTIYFPAGLYRIMHPIRLRGSCRLQGEGVNLTYILNDTDNQETVVCDFTEWDSENRKLLLHAELTGLTLGVWSKSVEKVETFSTIAGLKASAAVRIVGANHNMVIDYVRINSFNVGIDIEDSWYPIVKNFRIRFSKDYGIVYRNRNGGGSLLVQSGFISNVNLHDPEGLSRNEASGGGILYESGGGLCVTDVEVTSMSHGLIVQPGADAQAFYCNCTDFIADSCQFHGILLDAMCPGSKIRCLRCCRCGAAYNGLDGIVVRGDDIEEMSFVGGHIRENGRNGVHLCSGSHVTFDGVHIASNGRTEPGAAGIRIERDASHVIVANSHIGNHGSAHRNQAYGVVVAKQAHWINVSGNIFSGLKAACFDLPLRRRVFGFLFGPDIVATDNLCDRWGGSHGRH
jgi:hypothetical protein